MCKVLAVNSLGIYPQIKSANEMQQPRVKCIRLTTFVKIRGERLRIFAFVAGR